MPFAKTLDELKGAGYVFSNYATCKGCGADIEWWISPKGSKLPMEPMSRGTSEAKVHFASCPESDSFRKK